MLPRTKKQTTSMLERLKKARPAQRWATLKPARKFGFLFAATLLMGAAGGTLLFATPKTTIAAAPIVTDTASQQNDQLLAEAIFHAQKRGDYDWANQLMAQMQSHVLFGHILGERYLQPNYHATNQELTAWLAQYADHPQAAAIYRLAQRKGASDLTKPVDTAQLKGNGYVEHLGRSAMPQSWFTALRNYKEGSYSNARAQFVKIGDATNMSPWHRAAGYFWAARADEKLGRHADANALRKQAAEFTTTFYGQLASFQLRGTTPVMAAAPTVPDDIRTNPHALRAQALASINQRDLAEDELRQLAMTLSTSKRASILSLAGEMGLANLQVRLASLPGLSPEENLYGSYPMPHWAVNAQSIIDPSLLLAIARQESAFREATNHSSGAQGMMQMLPSTARHVEISLSPETLEVASADNTIPLSKQLDDPAVSFRLGAQYVAMLDREPAVKGNLLKLIAAYNAGPGSVQSWQGAARNVSDPLLYIESIPFPETRNYVMQVMAHQWVYQTLMGQEPQSLAALSQGQWPTLRG